MPMQSNRNIVKIFVNSKAYYYVYKLDQCTTEVMAKLTKYQSLYYVSV